MHDGRHDPPGNQRSAFSRHVAARRASDGPTATSTPRLPIIARGGGGGGSNPASAPLSSSSHLTSKNGVNDGSSLYTTTSTHRQSDGRSARVSTTADAPSFVITERTPRTELLAIVAQLQSDLAQRTDSVNAIQRNFTRLSAMHHAEQEELQRLRRLQSDLQAASQKEKGKDSELSAQRRLVEQLTAEVKERGTECARLQTQVTALREEQQHRLNVKELEQTCFAERQNVVCLETASYTGLLMAATAEQARLALKESASEKQQQRQSLLLRVLRAHTARLNSLTQGSDRERRDGDTATQTQRLLDPGTENSVFNNDEDPAMAAELQRAEEAVGTCVKAYEAAAAQRHTAVATAHQQELEDTQLRLLKAQQALYQVVISCEEAERQTLKKTAAETTESLTRSFQHSTTVLESQAHCTAETTLQLVDARARCSERIDAWTASAATRLEELRDVVDSWRAAYDSDLATQRRLLEEHGAEAHELAAARVEWASLRDTERKAHRAELAHVRQDTAAKVATLSTQRTTLQQRYAVLQQSLDDAQAATQASAAATERNLQARVQEAVAEREAVLSRQWFRVQSAQTQHTAELTGLLWTVSTTRIECGVEEAVARTALYRAYMLETAHFLQRRMAAQSLADSAQAVWRARVTHAVESEAAARLLVEAAAQVGFTELTDAAKSSMASLQHRRECSQLQQASEEAQRKAAEASSLHEAQRTQLEAELQNTREERRVALDGAADATASAQAAQQAENILREELRNSKAATAAAAQRIMAAESATESACCCALCLQLLYNPVACVPCGHVYCAGCLLWHGRNRGLSSLTAGAAAAGSSSSRRVSGVSTARVEVEVAQWMAGLTVSHTRLYCPECGTATVSALVELHSLGELAAKYSYQKGVLTELVRDLN